MRIGRFSVSSVSQEEVREQAKSGADGAGLRSVDPRLEHIGQLGELARAGWTEKDMERIVGDWPKANTPSLAKLIGYVKRLQERAGVESVDEAADWLLVILRNGPKGLVGPARLPFEELRKLKLKFAPATVVMLYVKVTGSPETALAALKAGKTVFEAKTAAEAGDL
jgi:hypothetical protein